MAGVGSISRSGLEVSCRGAVTHPGRLTVWTWSCGRSSARRASVGGVARRAAAAKVRTNGVDGFMTQNSLQDLCLVAHPQMSHTPEAAGTLIGPEIAKSRQPCI